MNSKPLFNLNDPTPPEPTEKQMMVQWAHQISLRDHFAGLVMQAFIAKPDLPRELICSQAYLVADMMLKEREKK